MVEVRMNRFSSTMNTFSTIENMNLWGWPRHFAIFSLLPENLSIFQKTTILTTIFPQIL